MHFAKSKGNLGGERPWNPQRKRGLHQTDQQNQERDQENPNKNE